MRLENIPERIEYKYFVPFLIRPYLLDDLKKFACLDTYSKDEEQGYKIASVYFENYALSSYHDKLQGKAKRLKIRLRFYPPLQNHDRIKMEFKYKIFDKCLKETTTIDYDQLCRLGRNEIFDFDKKQLGDNTLDHFLKTVKVNNFRPFIRIDYKRKAFYSNCDRNVRLTYDSEVRCCRFSGDIDAEPNIPVLSPRFGIFEIKTPGYFPVWLAEVVKKYSLMRTAISKYALSVQNLTVNNSMAII